MSAAVRSCRTSLVAGGLAAFLAFIPAIDHAAAAARGEVVAFSGGYPAGTIVVRTSERRLYLVLGQGRAIAYPVGVGRAGRQWSGTAFIDGKHIKPAWSPPADIKREQSASCPNVIAAARRTIRWAPRR